MQAQLLVQLRLTARVKRSLDNQPKKEGAEGEELPIRSEVLIEIIVSGVLQGEDDQGRVHGLLHGSGEEGFR